MAKHDKAIYRAVCKSLDGIFKTHGDGAATCINRYMRIRVETRQKERRIADLESELGELKKTESISRKRPYVV